MQFSLKKENFKDKRWYEFTPVDMWKNFTGDNENALFGRKFFWKKGIDGQKSNFYLEDFKNPDCYLWFQDLHENPEILFNKEFNMTDKEIY